MRRLLHYITIPYPSRSIFFGALANAMVGAAYFTVIVYLSIW